MVKEGNDKGAEKYENSIWALKSRSEIGTQFEVFHMKQFISDKEGRGVTSQV